MGVELAKWSEKVRNSEYLAEDELKALCEYVRLPADLTILGSQWAPLVSPKEDWLVRGPLQHTNLFGFFLVCRDLRLGFGTEATLPGC